MHNPKKCQAYLKELEKKAEEAEARYEAKVEELSERKDMSPEEIYGQEYKLYINIGEARKPDSEIMDQWRILINYNLLSGFYKSKCRYSPEFERFLSYIQKEGLGDNPLRIAYTLNS